MDFEELRDRVQAMVTCMVGADKAVSYAIDESWLRPIHENVNDRRNETLLAQAWVQERESRKQAITPTPSLVGGVTSTTTAQPTGQVTSKPFPGGESA